MKLIEDNGTVCEEIPNDAAIFYIESDRTMRMVLPKYKEGRIPFHVRLVRGLLSYLQFESNVKLVLRHAPTERNPRHRHH